jgi:NADH dehydrogenase FAD-containing subunit
MCKYCAESIASAMADEPGEPFRYFDKGIMAMIGRDAAVAEGESIATNLPVRLPSRHGLAFMHYCSSRRARR